MICNAACFVGVAVLHACGMLHVLVHVHVVIIPISMSAPVQVMQILTRTRTCGPSAFHSEFILICVGLLLCF